MWNDLNMQQRADVISMAVKVGLTDIDSIRSFYDESVGSGREFAGGGLTSKIKLDKNKIYNRLPAQTDSYISLDPFGISVGTSALARYYLGSDNTVDNIISKAKDRLRRIQDGEVLKPQGGLSSQERMKRAKIENNQILGLEDAKDIYLGMPQRSNTFEIADKSPTLGKLTNPYKSKYLSTDTDVIEKYLLPAYNNLLLGRVKGGDASSKDFKPGDLFSIGKSGNNGVTAIPILGNATIGKGIDPIKGPYVSYYDTWDVELSGNSGGKDNTVSFITGGKPFDIYDRIYLDDYYGVNSAGDANTYTGGYLPEVTVYGKKKAEGGNLYRNGGKKPTKEPIDLRRPNPTLAWYDPEQDIYYGRSLPEVIVEGQKKRRSAVDYLLYKADRHGAPSHIMNAVRDFNNRIQNFPVIALDAAKKYISGEANTIKEAYKQADTNPSDFAKKLLVYPYINDENNYSQEELAAMQDLINKSDKGPGVINYEGYRKQNEGRYAGDINGSNFSSPHKVIEWSLGQTGRTHDSEDNTYLFDDFAYDLKDTKGVYAKKALQGDINPVMALRTLFGVVGSKGYNDGSNSATSIRTLIPIEAIQDAYDNRKASGGSIHIKPSKRGTFTAAANKHGKSVQAFASQVLSNPGNYSPAMRKKANFARNASKWKHN